MTEPPIRTHGLTKHFGEVRALDDLDLEVRPGEVYGYLGPNGAGKTTTIRLLVDAIRPTRGAATILGGEPSDPEIRRRIGYLPAELQIDPRYTTNDVVAFFGSLRGGVDGAWVRKLLDRFDLDPTRPFGALSTGNRRKVGIVGAFMHRPELLVLDEPTSGLDPLLQRELLSLLRRTAREGAAVFLSSHTLPEVERVADRVGIIRHGHLVAVLGTDELRARARRRIDLHSPEAEPLAAALEDTPGVVSVRRQRGLVRLLLEGDVDPVLKAAARFTVNQIETHEPDLEELFLRFYRSRDERRRRTKKRTR